MLSAINFFMVLVLMFPSISHTLPNNEGRGNSGDGKELIGSQANVSPDDIDDCGYYRSPQFSGFQFLYHILKSFP